MKIKGTITPDIASKVSGYDFDVRTTRSTVNLHFDNGHAKTDLVCYKLGNNKFEVEVLFDPLHLFPSKLDKGDIMNTSEIANVMIRQALKENDMITQSKKKKNYNVTGMEDGDLVGADVPCDGVACSLGTFVDVNDDIEMIVNSLDNLNVPTSDKIVYFDDGVCFIPSAYVAQSFDKEKDANFYQIMQLIRNVIGSDKFETVTRRAFSLDKNTGVIDLDNLFGTNLREFGRLIYSANDHTWTWVANNGETVTNLTNTEIISIMKFIPQFVKLTNTDKGKSGKLERHGGNMLREKLLEKRNIA